MNVPAIGRGRARALEDMLGVLFTLNQGALVPHVYRFAKVGELEPPALSAGSGGAP